MRVLPLALLAALALPASSQPAPLLDENARRLAVSRVEAGAYPSLVIGVTRGGKREIVGFGTLGAGKKPDGDTVYEIGSVTKTFTALLLADAVARGETTLDTPVQKLLPGFSVPKFAAPSADRAITLLDLATQSSGLPRLPDNLLPKNPANPYADYTAEDLKKFLAGHRLSRAPGASYEYSNLGFGLLGLALATRSGQRYEDLVKARITTPLGLKDTAITLPPRLQQRFAPGTDPKGQRTPPWDLGALQGAGAVRSTATDLLAYVEAFMRPPTGALAKAIPLTKEARRETEGGARIGLAWQIVSKGGRDVLWHNGMTGGYASFVAFTADGERGVVVLTNIGHEVGEIGFAALLPETMATNGSSKDGPKEVTISPEALAEYAGRYRLAPGFDLTLEVKDGELTAQATGQQSVPVFASARDAFFYKVVDAQLTFQRDASGKVSGVTLHQNGRDMPAPRVESAPTSMAPPTPRPKVQLDAAKLASYAGRYELAPGFVLHVTVESGQLFVQATAQPRLAAFASASDELFLEAVDAQLSVERGADGKVVAMTLHQNGRDLRGPRLPD